MNKKYLFAFVFAFTVFLTACGSPPREYITELSESAFAGKSESSSAAESTALVGVYVCGAVEAPGVVELPEGARVADAIAAAGGLRADADTRLLNQARRVADGEQITVLTAVEAEAYLKDDPGQLSGKQSGAPVSDGRVNLNLADAETLKTLPGIGEAKAEAIVQYRKANGAFERIEDVCNVPGIKGSVFDKIRDRITV